MARIHPTALYRAVLAFCFYSYYVVTRNPTANSISTHYADGWQPLSTFIDAVLPVLFVVSIIAVMILGKQYPYRVALIASIPQMIYMILSVNWYLELYPTLNPAAAFIHITITLMIFAFAWKGLYEPPNEWTH